MVRSYSLEKVETGSINPGSAKEFVYAGGLREGGGDSLCWFLRSVGYIK